MSVDAAFALEHFAWEGPDRLSLSGWFSGLDSHPADAPVLVLQGTERVRRLPADPDASVGLPEDGKRWSATFAWEEPPEAFDAAALEVGAGLVIPLPEPGPENRARGAEVLRIRPAGSEPTGAADRLRLQGEVLAAQEELAQLRAELERATEGLERARQDLHDERRRHAADAERYRDGLAQVRAAADDAVAEVRADAEAQRARAEESARRLSLVMAPVAKARADTATLLGQLANLEQALDEPE
jgi:hypothetical protein